MQSPKSKIPSQLRAGIAAILLATGGGYTAYDYLQKDAAKMLQNEYVATVASDVGTSEAVKVAMVMGAYYESSYKHIGKPYVDKLGRGQPLSVCNGVTGREVVAGRYYAPADCYGLEKARYLASEQYLKSKLPNWQTYTVFQQAVFIDFTWNKGQQAFDSSTMRRRLETGDVVGACRENLKWTKGTVNGVLTVLPGLKNRADANEELCERGLG